jgi:phosphatidylglycerophosphate synthase
VAGRTDGILRILCWLGAAGGIQLRLLANLFDGMVAVEGGLRTKSGEIFNELPDRISDVVIFVGVGHSGRRQRNEG